MTARYDAIADFYEAGWQDAIDDPAATALLALLGSVARQRVLDVACGHGRLTRELARRGATAVGVDIAGSLIAKARATEDTEPLGIRYIHADAASQSWADGQSVDAVTCSFALSDIDDLDNALAQVSRVLGSGGRFVFSILHPCFPGGRNVSGAWPTAASYFHEGWWAADGTLSTLRREVGANHRMLSTYVNALRRHDLWLDELAEPAPATEWAVERPDAARYPVFLAARCVKR